MTSHRTLSYVVALTVGIVLGVLGTFAHRSLVPWGLVLTLVACVGAGVWLRASFGPTSVMAYLVGWVVAVQVLAAGGPGGDTQIVADTTGYVWAYGTALLVLGVLALPRSWFADVEVARPRATGRDVPTATHDQNVG